MFSHPELSGLQVKAELAAGSVGTSVALTASGSLKTRFMSALGVPTMNLAARSTAAAHSDGFGCVLALDTNASGAITAQGNTSVTLTDCSLYDNSADPTALKAGGTAKIVARSIGVVGGVSGEENIVTTDGLRTGVAAVIDPYADVSPPSFSGCTENNFTGRTVQTLEPGVYCGGMSLNAGAVVTLNPGIYYLDRGNLHVTGGATLIGKGVTLVFTSSTDKNWATATVNGNAIIDLTPPISGPTAGIVVFANRRIPAGTTFKFNGGATQYLGGAVYVHGGSGICGRRRDQYQLHAAHRRHGDVHRQCQCRRQLQRLSHPAVRTDDGEAQFLKAPGAPAGRLSFKLSRIFLESRKSSTALSKITNIDQCMDCR
jgi:hypothetical protein